MDYHKINKTVIDGTQELCDKVAALKNAVASSIEREYILYGDDDVELGSVVPNEEMEIVVSRERTFEAAEKYRASKSVLQKSKTEPWIPKRVRNDKNANCTFCEII